VEIYATLPSPVSSVLVRISLDVTQGGDHSAMLDTEQVNVIVVKRTKLNL